MGNGAPEAPNHERHRREKEARPPPEYVREPAIERLEGGAGDEVGRSQPGGVVRGLELASDQGVSARGDCAIKPRKEDVGIKG